MSMDFDAAALQTQHEEEDDDEADYERQQELHKLLTDLPDDMLEDSRDCSSPEPEDYSSHQRPQPAWTQQMQWAAHHGETDHRGQFSVQTTSGVPGGGPPHGAPQPWVTTSSVPGGGLPHGAPQPWVHQSGDGQYSQGGYSYISVGTEEDDPSTELGYPSGTDADGQHRNHANSAEGPEADQETPDLYHTTYKPQNTLPHPPLPPEGSEMDHLQRHFLHSTQNGADSQQVLQLQVLHKAQQRQMEDLEKRLEDSQRNARSLQHQLAIVRDEKEGVAVSLMESSRMVEESKDREVQLKNTVHSLEQNVQSLTDRETQNLRQLQAAEASMDSMKLQISDLCRSETLSRTRQQHERHLEAMKEQHEAKVLALSQRLDATSEALNEQTEVAQRSRQQVVQLERQREEEQLERSKVINTLNQRLEESQRQCAALLTSGSVQEMNQMEAKLQQAQKAKTLSENMSHSLQEDVAELKEQITLYESAVKMGAVSLERGGADWEKQLSESYVDLGIKKSNWKNSTIHSDLSEDGVKELRAELQRCLVCLKGKRQKISRLQDQLDQSEARGSQLQHSLDDATMKESTQHHLDVSGASQKGLLRLQQDKQNLQEQLENLEKQNEELRQSEENLKAVNAELCSKMRQMIQELDQEKQEDAERYERTQQQYRNDVVHRVRTQLTSEHKGHLDQLTAAHQRDVLKLQTELSEATDRLTATQEDYVSVCKEKDQLEARKVKLRDEITRAVQKLRSELEAEHQINIQAHLASARTAWEEERMKMERTSVQSETQTETPEDRRAETAETLDKVSQTGGGGGVSLCEEACQTETPLEAAQTGGGVSPEQLASALGVQRQQLLLEAEKAGLRAVEDARMETRRELQQKYLEDMTTQVEGALTRAYSRWLEDLTSLPEYKERLQREKEQWTEQHQRHLQQQVSQARSEAEGEELQHRVDRLRTEQEVLMRAQLAEARASWSRERQQQVSSQQEALRQREEQWSRQLRDEEQRSRQTVLLELQTELSELQTEERSSEVIRRSSETSSVSSRRSSEMSSVSSMVQTSYRELLQKARRQWRTASEDRLSRVLKEMKEQHQSVLKETKEQHQSVLKETKEQHQSVLKETKEQHQSEIRRIQSSAPQKEEAVCGPRCAERTGKLQQKIQELQRHLEKACRQLQLSVRQNKAAMQRLREEHEETLQKLKEKHCIRLDEVKNNNELSQKQNLEKGLEEMKAQYHNAVEKIRGDMLQYLQDSKQKALQMIRVEVQKERQITARKMRHYYLSCLQDLLEDGGQSTGAEKKIMNAASKLASMARVLETPVKRKPGKSPNVQVVKVSECPTVSDPQSTETHPDMRTTTSGTKDPHLLPCRPSPSPSGGKSVTTVPVRGRKTSRDHVTTLGSSDWTTMQEVPVRDHQWAHGDRMAFPGGAVSASLRGSPDERSPAPGASVDDEAFGGYLTPDSSDFTVYNEIMANVPTPSSHRL